MELVTIQTYTYPQDMAIVRSLLESEGIETFVLDEVISQVNPFYANAVGGIKLQVESRDVQKAMEVLQEKGFINKPASQTPAFEDKLSGIVSTHRKLIYRIVFVLFAALAVMCYYIFRNS
jgi:hypothetical protein